MEWYYAEEGQQIGPVKGSEFQLLVESGKITTDTMVWHEGMEDWKPYGQAISIASGVAPAGVQPAPTAAQSACCECGRVFNQNDMIRHGDSWVCAACKPVFLQRIKEGAVLPGVMKYGGFWIRFGAKFIDGLILQAVNFGMGLLGSMIGSAFESPGAALATQGVVMLLSILTAATYTTLLVGRYGATLGKMACGLRVVMPDGSKVSYGRALGRYFAEMLSGLTFSIGYIMAAFDDEKRTLHDRICNTRVIVKR